MTDQGVSSVSQTALSNDEQITPRRNLGDILKEIFLPTLPALIGAGILQGITAVFVAFDVLDEGTPLHTVLSTISAGIFYYLPFLIAPSTAKAFRSSPYMAIAVVAFFLHPDMVTAMADNRDYFLLGIPVVKTTYTSSVIPIILMIWAMSYIHRWAERVIPQMIKSVIVPAVTIGVTCVVGLLILGPIGHWLTELIAWVINTFDDHAPWMVPLIVGGLGAILISVGLSFALFPIALTSMSTSGYDTVYGPGMLASNMALAGMALAVALKATNISYRSYSVSASATALLGVSQPAVYGIATILRRPLLAAMAGGAAGGLVAGLTGFKVFALSPAGLVGIPVYIDPGGGNNLLLAIVVMVVAFVVAFAAAWFIGFDQPDQETIDQVTGEAAA